MGVYKEFNPLICIVNCHDDWERFDYEYILLEEIETKYRSLNQ